MKNPIFGDVKFDTGWKTKMDICLFGKSYAVVVKARSYREEDAITSEQETAFGDFLRNRSNLLKSAENALSDFSDGNASSRFLPTMLLMERDGGYALLLDDEENKDEGVAVLLAPKMKVVSQDEYL